MVEVIITRRELWCSWLIYLHRGYHTRTEHIVLTPSTRKHMYNLMTPTISSSSSEIVLSAVRTESF